MGSVVSLADYREAAKLPLPAPSAEYSTAAFLEKYVKPASEWSRGCFYRQVISMEAS